MTANYDRFAPESREDFRERNMTEREKRIARQRALHAHDDDEGSDEPIFRSPPDEQED